MSFSDDDHNLLSSDTWKISGRVTCETLEEGLDDKYNSVLTGEVRLPGLSRQ